MSTTPANQAGARFYRGAVPELEARDGARIVVQPIAPPSVLGLFGFAAATFIVAAHLAGWYGTSRSPEYLFPFAAVFGGLAQFIAGMWAYRARDALGTAMHGMWGSFWIAYGILFLLVAVGALTVPATGKFPELGFWFLALGAITLCGTLAAIGESFALVCVLGTLAAGSAFLAIHYLTGSGGWQTVAGWVLIASAILATYTATAMTLESSWGRAVLPLGKRARRTTTLERPVTEPVT
jgi:succinate-acetate transporter protein